MVIILVLLLLLLLAGAVEYQLHLHYLRRIPIRVHVNGSRGKSSVTRLIAAGLNAAGIDTIAKTTGSATRFIYPNGREDALKRRGPANVREQTCVVKKAAQAGVQALAIECMALLPDLQEFCERKLIRSTVGVITNVRPDHLDFMGPALEDAAWSIASTIPHAGHLFTAEREFLSVFSEIAARHGTELHEVSESHFPSDDEMSRFSYIEHPENVACALAVCEHLGVARSTALEAMWHVTPDPGVLRITPFKLSGKKITFVNAFAANDEKSTLSIFRRLRLGPDSQKPLIVTVNIRRDRAQRAEGLGRLIGRTLRADHYLLVGDLTHAVLHAAKKAGVEQERVEALGRASAEEIMARVTALTRAECVNVGIGNIGGIGAKICQFVQQIAAANGQTVNSEACSAA